MLWLTVLMNSYRKQTMNIDLEFFHNASYDGIIYARYNTPRKNINIKYTLFRDEDVICEVTENSANALVHFHNQPLGVYAVLAEVISDQGEILSLAEKSLHIKHTVGEEDMRDRSNLSLKGGHCFYENVDDCIVHVKFVPGGLKHLMRNWHHKLSIFSRLRNNLEFTRTFGDVIIKDKGYRELSGIYTLSANLHKKDMIGLAEELETLSYVVYCSITPTCVQYDDNFDPFYRPHHTAREDSFEGNSDISFDAGAEYTIPTPDFLPLQTYLKAGKGMNVSAAWKAGFSGKGINVHIMDSGIYPEHEDLVNNITVISGGNSDSNRNHGSASAGCIAASPNGFGMTGIAHHSHLYYYGAGDIDVIIQHANPGDIISTSIVFVAKTIQGDLYQVPRVENKYWWDVIHAMSKKGIVVLMSAGNGLVKGALKENIGVDLLDPSNNMNQYGDSGGIIVGACRHDTGTRVSFSNYSHESLYMNSWGDWSVATTGYGGLYDKGENRKYADNYAGTSSAAPLCAGSLAVIQSFCKQKYGVILSTYEFRKLLKKTGYTQGLNDKIGYRPDVYGAITYLDNKFSNAIRNGDFLNSTDSWTVHGDVKVVHDENDSAAYDNSAALFVPTYSITKPYIEQSFSVEPSKTYRVAFRYRAATTGGALKVSASPFGLSAGDNLGEIIVECTAHYKEAHFQFTCKPDMKKVHIRIQNINAPQSRSVLVKDVLINENQIKIDKYKYYYYHKSFGYWWYEPHVEVMNSVHKPVADITVCFRIHKSRYMTGGPNAGSVAPESYEYFEVATDDYGRTPLRQVAGYASDQYVSFRAWIKGGQEEPDEWVNMWGGKQNDYVEAPSDWQVWHTPE